MQASPTLIQQPRICVAIRPGPAGEIGRAAARAAIEQRQIDEAVIRLNQKLLTRVATLFENNPQIKNDYLSLIKVKTDLLNGMRTNTIAKINLAVSLIQDYDTLIKLYA